MLVERDRSGVTADFNLQRADKAQTVAGLASVLATEAVLCTDCVGALVAAARHLGVEHHALIISTGPRDRGLWHVQNVNADHGRFKNWMRRFKGVASSYLASYLGWFRALDRSAQTPRQPAPFLAMAVASEAVTEGILKEPKAKAKALPISKLVQPRGLHGGGKGRARENA